MKVKTHPVYKHLKVYEDGRIFSTKSNKFLSQRPNDRGYILMEVSSTLELRKTVRAHRLVLEAFKGKCPKGMCCAHLNGISLALREWVKPIAYCEIDRYAQAVLLSRMSEGHLPRAPIWDDITTLDGKQFRGQVDIIYGGFPCQDISVAGNRKGLAGERSGLFKELVRLAEEIKPKFLFLENVPAIRTRGAREVSESLSSIGYDQRWDIISAREVGASFLGERWFLVAAANGKALRIEQRRWNGARGKAAALHPSACDLRIAPWSSERGFESQVFGTGNGLPFAVDRDHCLGNAVVPEQAKEAFMRLMGKELQ